MIYVCPLSRLDETVIGVRARQLVSVLNAGTPMTRPAAIREQDHLLLNMNDIAEAREGLTSPGEEHVRRLLEFATLWDRSSPLVINCYAGISRSTASAYIIASTLSPSRDEAELAATLRRMSPSATPNPLLISIADRVLGRGGRMVQAIRAIGRGADAFEGTPFALRVDP